MLRRFAMLAVESDQMCFVTLQHKMALIREQDRHCEQVCAIFPQLLIFGGHSYHKSVQCRITHTDNTIRGHICISVTCCIQVGEVYT